jgi:hypothetical protein
MRSLWFVIAVALPVGLAAQNPGDSGVASDSVRLESLRQEILDRYRTRAHEVLNLSTDQAGRFDSTQAHAWVERRDLMLQRQRINMALRWQLRPGVAANPDSVNTLLDSRRRVSESLFRVDDQEDRDMAGFLTPVQRAQYQEFRQRFRERVAEVLRGGRPGMMRPGMRPGRRPRP